MLPSSWIDEVHLPVHHVGAGEGVQFLAVGAPWGQL